MKRFLPLALLATLIPIGFLSCVIVNFSDLNSVSGKGELESFEFRVGEFDRIRVAGNIDINYHAASLSGTNSDTVRLEVQPNLLEYIVVEQVAGELVIRTTRGINFHSSITPILTVSVPLLEALTITGASNFTAHDTIRAESLQLRVTGSGTFRADLDVQTLTTGISGSGSFLLSGRADSVDLDISGSANLYGLELQSLKTSIRLSGAARVEISCSQDLSVRASGAGSVRYRGEPSLNVNTSGAVSVRRMD